MKNNKYLDIMRIIDKNAHIKNNNEELPMPRLKAKTSKPKPSSLLDDFKQGDLLFGLANERKPYTDKLRERKNTYYSANHLNIPLVDTFLNTGLTEEKVQDLPEKEASHARLLLKHSALLTKPGGKDPWGEQTPEEKKKGVVIRRACKLLVKTAKENQSVGAIRFVLDGIDIQRVCTKQTADGMIDTSITSGELRAAYRTRHKNRGAIRFYKEGQRVHAPWRKKTDKNRDWQAYEQSRLINKK